MLKIEVSGPPWTPSGHSLGLDTFLAASSRTQFRSSSTGQLLGLLRRWLAWLQTLGVLQQLSGELLVLVGELENAVLGNPVVPAGLPALVVDLELPSLAVLARPNVENLGLVQHFHVKAQHPLILLEWRTGGLLRGRHDVAVSSLSKAAKLVV